MAQNTKKKEYFTLEQVEEAIRSSGAIYTAAAQLLAKATKRPCSPNTVRNYIRRHKRLAKVEKEVREQTLDIAESKLITKIGEGNLTAIIFYLKTKGKERGFVERGELTGKDGEELVPALLRVPPRSASSDEWLGQHKPTA